MINRSDYPALADNVIRGELAGSYAGDEQPEFTAFSGESSSCVIVKFSPQGDSEIARRWRDILITEFHATATLRAASFSAAQTRLIEEVVADYFLNHSDLIVAGNMTCVLWALLQRVGRSCYRRGRGKPAA